MPKKSKIKKTSVDSDRNSIIEECARIAEKHGCGYDCCSEDVNGDTHYNGFCKYDIASEIRMLRIS